MYIAYGFILGLTGGFVLSAFWGLGEAIADRTTRWLDKRFPIN